MKTKDLRPGMLVKMRDNTELIVFPCIDGVFLSNGREYYDLNIEYNEDLIHKVFDIHDIMQVFISKKPCPLYTINYSKKNPEKCPVALLWERYEQ